MGDPQCHHHTTYLYQTPNHIKTVKITCKLNTKKPNWDSIKELLVLCYYYQPGCRVWISPISLLLFPCQLLKPQLFDFSGQPLVSVNISITETKLPPMKTIPCFQERLQRVENSSDTPDPSLNVSISAGNQYWTRSMASLFLACKSRTSPFWLW